MALRVGIHSDSRLKDNCLEYNAFPVGFANADFEGGLGNPYLTGIKPPKYQRSAPKPVSADVMAVNSARFMQGNQMSNARAILSQFQKEAKAWKPPPVRLLSAPEVFDRLYAELAAEDREMDLFGDARTIEEIREERNNRFYSTLQPKLSIPSRGTQLVVQTIGSQAEIPSMEEFQERLRRQDRGTQLQMLEKIASRLARSGILLGNYDPTQITKTENDRVQQLRILIERGFSQGSNLDIMRILTPLSQAVPPERMERESSTGSSSSAIVQAVMGSSSADKSPATPQGIALTATSSTTQEVEKK